METFSGSGVSGGAVIGKIFAFGKEEGAPEKKVVADADSEFKRLQAALALAKEELEQLYQDAVVQVGEENARIFEIHQMMLEDLDYLESIERLIKKEKLTAEYSVFVTAEFFSGTFAEMDDEYMKARSIDVLDVSKRVIRKLTGTSEKCLESADAVIILADDLTPSETIHLDPSKVLAFVTRKGSSNSHTAILARSLNIPAIVNVNFSPESLDVFDGREAAVDAVSGRFYVDPDEQTMQSIAAFIKQRNLDRQALDALKGKENITTDGRTIRIFANIGGREDVESVLENDAGGIGLFRSEFFYLGRQEAPSEEEQFAHFKEVSERMAGRQVIIRTLDIGADKKVDYLGLQEEENPALGFRAIRICLHQPEIFRTQLRAIYRASVFGNVGIMFPMITSVEEVRCIKEIVREVREELISERIPVGNPELGIMIETPAAALISDELAKEVDFFSVGTNDLTQYTLAIDRQNEKLSEFYDPHHRGVLMLIQMACENAHQNGIWIGICGELAGDLELTKTFVDMGIDELSVSPAKVLLLRKVVRTL